MLAAILGFLRALPELISLFKELSAKLSDTLEVLKQNALNAKVKDALEEAVKTKNTEALEAILRGLK